MRAPGFPVAVLYVNLTALNRARLLTVLQHADDVGARHLLASDPPWLPFHVGVSPRFVRRLALRLEPPCSRPGVTRQGGCDILWHDFGGSSPLRFHLPAQEADRAVGHVFAEFTVVSVYLPVESAFW
eukprot:s1529_g8.t1